jgi:hypothetical protein
MKVRKSLTALGLLVVVPVAAACSAAAATAGTDTASSTTSQSTESSSDAESSSDTETPGGNGGPGGVDASSVSTEDQLIALIQEAYGDASLGLHRGHEPVQDVLTEVLAISHDELHVRMEEQGQNLAAVATDIGVAPQTLIDAMVTSWRPAIDNLLEAGTITQEEADGYLQALEDAFTFRVNWDGQEATPTFSGLDS